MAKKTKMTKTKTRQEKRKIMPETKHETNRTPKKQKQSTIQVESIVLGSWNVEGLEGNKLATQRWLAEEKPHIALLQEHWVVGKMRRVDGDYSTFSKSARKTRSRPSGGLSTMVKHRGGGGEGGGKKKRKGREFWW